MSTVRLILAKSQSNQRDSIHATAKRFRAVSPNLADADYVDSEAAIALGNNARGLEFASAALARNPKMTLAFRNQINTLSVMFAYDQFSEDIWAFLPAFYRPAYYGNWPAATALVLKSGAAAWDDPSQVKILANAGEPAAAARVFDARFENVAAYLATPTAEEGGAIALAGAFDSVGRSADAKVLRRFARSKMTRAEANGTSVAYNAINWATLLLSEGDRAGALTKLERGIDTAWWPVCTSFPWIGEQFRLRPLNGDPRFEAVKGRCRTEINKQRKLAGLAPAVLK